MIMMPTLIDIDVAAGIKEQTVKVMIQHAADTVAGKLQTCTVLETVQIWVKSGSHMACMHMLPPCRTS